MRKMQNLAIGIVFAISILTLFALFIISLNNIAAQETDNIAEQTEIQNEKTIEPIPAFHGLHVTIQNVTESTSWLYPQNSTLEDLAAMGYESINITPQDIEKYSYLKEGLKPGAPNGEFTRALEDEEKDEFFEKFYGKSFSYGDHNYVINSYKN